MNSKPNRHLALAILLIFPVWVLGFDLIDGASSVHGGWLALACVCSGLASIRSIVTNMRRA